MWRVAGRAGGGVDCPGVVASVPHVSPTAAPEPPPAVDGPGRDPRWPAGMLAIVPVYNHARTVAQVVAGLRALGATVLTVDDGSTDGSGEAARAAGAELLTLAPNQGKGAALRAGFAWASARGWRQALTCDADGQHPTSEAARVAAAAGDPATIYVGRRAMAHAPASSRFGRWWSNLWTWIACGAWVGDSQSGLRVYPLPHAGELPHSADRYSYEVEVLVRGVWAGLAVQPVEVAVLYPADRVSHFHKLRDNCRTAGTFARLVARRLWPARHRQLVERPRLSARERVRAILTSGLQPWPAGAACALGAGIGVAPVPGLQFALAAFLSWRLGLNMPLVLLTSNLSFGPLLAVWGGASSALGLWMRTGAPPLEAYRAISNEFHTRLAGQDLWGQVRTITDLMTMFIGDWVLGSLVVVPTVAAVAGLSGYLVFRAVGRR